MSRFDDDDEDGDDYHGVDGDDDGDDVGDVPVWIISLERLLLFIIIIIDHPHQCFLGEHLVMLSIIIIIVIIIIIILIIRLCKNMREL